MLPKQTEKVWEFLKSQPGLAGFVLIGGTALALRLHHRISEDLDLVWVGEKLPRARLDALSRSGSTRAIQFQVNDDPAATEEFESGGLDLRDYQQDYVVDGKVNVSFFTASDGLERVLTEGKTSEIRIATLAELFKTKCLVSALPSKSRDWLDLYLLMREHGFSLDDYYQAFVEANRDRETDNGLSRLCSGVPQRNDEGFAHLLANAPTLEQMRSYFVELRDQFEVRRASEARRQPPGTNSSTLV